MSTYTPAGIQCLRHRRRAAQPKKTPPNSPPRPAAKRSPQKQKRVTPRDLELVPVLLCVARVAYFATWPQALELVLLLVACREGSARPHSRAAVRGHGPIRGPEHPQT